MTDLLDASVDGDELTDLDRALEAYRRLVAHHTRLATDQAGRLGLNLTDLRLLFALDVEGPAGLLPKEVTRFLGISSGATTSLVDRLEARSLVQRVPNPDDRRSVVVVILDGGTRMVDAVRATYRDALTAAVPAEETARFAASLEALDRALADRALLDDGVPSSP